MTDTNTAAALSADFTVENIASLIRKHALTRSGEKVTPRESVTAAQVIYDLHRLATPAPAALEGGLETGQPNALEPMDPALLIHNLVGLRQLLDIERGSNWQGRCHFLNQTIRTVQHLAALQPSSAADAKPVACSDEALEIANAAHRADMLYRALVEVRDSVETYPLDDSQTCMCGSPVEGHNVGSGHAPVSQADHAISLIVEAIDKALGIAVIPDDALIGAGRPDDYEGPDVGMHDTEIVESEND